MKNQALELIWIHREWAFDYYGFWGFSLEKSLSNDYEKSSSRINLNPSWMSIRLLRFLRIISLSLSLSLSSARASRQVCERYTSGSFTNQAVQEFCGCWLSHVSSCLTTCLLFRIHYILIFRVTNLLFRIHNNNLYRSSIVGSNPVACLTLNLTIRLRTSRDSRRVSPLTLSLRDSIRREVGSTHSWCSPQLCSTSQHGRILLWMDWYLLRTERRCPSRFDHSFVSLFFWFQYYK